MSPRRVGIGAVAILAAMMLAAIPAVAAGHGWKVEWREDFNGRAGALPSTKRWIIDTGHGYPGGPPNWGTGEVQRYTDDPSNLSLDGKGHLTITPRRDSNGEWTSARIETTRSDFKAPTNGILRIEGRIQMPETTGDAALGYWSAFWALGSPYRGNFWNWPSIGEFDIMENVNGLNRVWGVLHCGVAPGGPCNEFNGVGDSTVCPGSPCQATFHTYRFEWDRSVNPNQLRWYVDGQMYHTVTENQVDASTWTAMTSHEGYFILLNVAVGGGFPDGVAGHPTPTERTVPGTPMVVDYVRVSTLRSRR